MRARGRGAAACLVAALALTACGEQTGSTGTGASPAASSPAAPPTRSPKRPAVRVPGTDEEVQPTCRPGDPVAIGRSIVEAALGHRYLALTARSCTDRPVLLQQPRITGSNRLRTRDLAMRPSSTTRPGGAFTLRPGDTAMAGIEWLAQPRLGWVHSLEVTTGEGDRADVLRFTDLDLRPATRLRYHPGRRARPRSSEPPAQVCSSGTTASGSDVG